jgi:hypothetical protein
MITKPHKNTVKQSQDFKSYSFGIKKEGLSHIFNVLRNQLYSDKVLAVIREYSCNAVDAHTEVGKDEPILVTLPNQLSPYFKVRDYGRGLTEKEIGEIYAMYGESTKRGTNEQIGQLGLGSKSAFAYGDNFVINSFVKGRKTSYNAFIDSTQIGQISKMGWEKSKEKDGVEIVVPVKNDDFRAFREKALDLFTHFTIRPEIKGADESNFYAECLPSVMSSDDWTIRQNGDSYAVMGNIAYPLKSSSLDYEYRSTRYELLNEVGLTIYFKIGDLDISASREALQYTDETKKTITRKLDEILAEIPRKISETMKDCKNLWDAKCVYGDLFKHGGIGSSLSRVLDRQQLKWTNPLGFQTKIEDNTFSFAKKMDAEVRLFQKPHSYSRKKRVTAEEQVAVLAANENILIIDDRAGDMGGIGLGGKMIPLVKEFDARPKDAPLYKAAYLLTFKNKATANHFYKKCGKKNFKKLSELPKSKLSEIYPTDGNGGGNGAKSSKHTTKEFVYDIEEASGGNSWESVKSRHFKETSVDIDSVKNGLCVEIDRFYVMRKSMEKNPVPYAKNVASVLNAIGVKMPKVYAFKPKKYAKVIAKKNWTNLHDYIAAKVKGKFNDAFMQKVAERKFVSNLEGTGYGYGRSSQNGISDNQKHWFDFTCFMKKNANMGDLNGNSPFAKLFSWVADKFHEGDHKKIDAVLNSCKDFVELKGDESKTNKIADDFVKLVQKCINRYPLVKHFDHDIFRPYRNADKEFCKESINYMNVIDVSYENTENIFDKAQSKK